MLKLFEVVGFKSFKDKITLDFSDVRDYKFNTECIIDNLIGKLIVYGKNSVGKSNLGLAMFDIVTHLTTKNVGPHLYDYYLNVTGLNDYAEFHYVFQFDNSYVDYIYRKNEKQMLIYEKISIDDKVLFEYDYNKDKGNVKGISELAPTLNLSFYDVDGILKYTINNTILDDSHPLRQMMAYVNNMLWFRNLDENRYVGYKNKSNAGFSYSSAK